MARLHPPTLPIVAPLWRTDRPPPGKQSINFLLNSPALLQPTVALRNARQVADRHHATANKPPQSLFGLKPESMSLIHLIAPSAAPAAFENGLDITEDPARRRRRRPAVRAHCCLCSRTFSAAAALRKHERAVHLGLKPHECSVCKRRFAEKANMKKHFVARHELARTHPCKECPRVFAFSDGLRRHNNDRHLKIRRFICSDCPSAFKQKTHLQKHRESVHGVLRQRGGG